MFYVKFLRDGKGYWIDESHGRKIEILGLFLMSDVGCSFISGWKDWVNNSKYEDTASNLTFLEKEGNKIIVGYLYTEEDEDEYETAFETTREHFLEILDKWEELCKQMPKEIIITKEGDKVTLEGRN